MDKTADRKSPPPLPVGQVSPHAPQRQGFWGLVATEGALFGALLFSYFYTAFRVDRDWPPEGLPHLILSGPNTILLILSSATLWFGERRLRQGRKGIMPSLLVTLGLGIAFVFIQLKEWSNKTYAFNEHAYASHFFVITGFHLAHVLFGMLLLAAACTWSAMGYLTRERHEPLAAVSLYWHFVDVVWLCVFFSLYISPYLLR